MKTLYVKVYSDTSTEIIEIPMNTWEVDSGTLLIYTDDADNCGGNLSTAIPKNEWLGASQHRENLSALGVVRLEDNEAEKSYNPGI